MRRNVRQRLRYAHVGIEYSWEGYFARNFVPVGNLGRAYRPRGPRLHHGGAAVPPPAPPPPEDFEPPSLGEGEIAPPPPPPRNDSLFLWLQRGWVFAHRAQNIAGRPFRVFVPPVGNRWNPADPPIPRGRYDNYNMPLEYRINDAGIPRPTPAAMLPRAWIRNGDTRRRLYAFQHEFYALFFSPLQYTFWMKRHVIRPFDHLRAQVFFSHNRHYFGTPNVVQTAFEHAPGEPFHHVREYTGNQFHEAFDQAVVQTVRNLSQAVGAILQRQHLPEERWPITAHLLINMSLAFIAFSMGFDTTKMNPTRRYFDGARNDHEVELDFPPNTPPEVMRPIRSLIRASWNITSAAILVARQPVAHEHYDDRRRIRLEIRFDPERNGEVRCYFRPNALAVLFTRSMLGMLQYVTQDQELEVRFGHWLTMANFNRVRIVFSIEFNYVQRAGAGYRLFRGNMDARIHTQKQTLGIQELIVMFSLLNDVQDRYNGAPWPGARHGPLAVTYNELLSDLTEQFRRLYFTRTAQQLLAAPDVQGGVDDEDPAAAGLDADFWRFRYRDARPNLMDPAQLQRYDAPGLMEPSDAINFWPALQDQSIVGVTMARINVEITNQTFTPHTLINRAHSETEWNADSAFLFHGQYDPPQ